MVSPTLLIEPGELEAVEVRVEGAAHHHLFRVRRLAAGQRIRLVDGEGRARWAEILRIGRRSALLRPGAPAPENEAPWRLEVLVGALRRERASWLVEKATELGVAAVRFIASERSSRHFGGGTLERLERVARAAVEQSARSRLPEISGVHPWSELSRLTAGCGRLWLLDPGAAGKLASADADAAVLVGPEGGWSEAERRQLEDLGARPWSLGPRVLRVETAAVAAAACLLLR